MKYLVIILLLLSCSDSNQPREKKLYGWKEIQQKKEIEFLFSNSSASFENGRDGVPEGFEYELARQFAKDHSLKFKYRTLESVDQILEQISLGNGHIGAASVTHTEYRSENFNFGPSYFSVHQVVVCKKRKKIKSTKDLSKLKIMIPTQTSFTETLLYLKSLYPELVWEEKEDENSESMLQEIWKNPEYCTMMDSHMAALHRRYLPELKIVFKFKKENKIGWVMDKENTELKKKVEQWFQLKSSQKLVKHLKRKYFEFIAFDPYNLKVFNARIQDRLPQYLDLFKKAAQKYKMEWELLAAVSYQESFWNPKAKSPTGVRGIMMLTRRTAKSVGVTNRLDPVQSIEGGAKYLSKLLHRIPSYVRQEDKIWFALAAYNVGFYHLRDAMALSIWQNENPTAWPSIEKVLPLLAQRKYYKKLPYGHARGFEPVIYVQRIKDFYDILKSKTKFSTL